MLLPHTSSGVCLLPMLHPLRSPYPGFQGSCQLSLLVSIFLFPFFSPRRAPFYVLSGSSGSHSVSLHCSSGREIEADSGAWERKPRLLSLVYPSRQWAYLQNISSTSSASPCDRDKEYRTEQGIYALLPSRGSQTCWKMSHTQIILMLSNKGCT